MSSPALSRGAKPPLLSPEGVGEGLAKEPEAAVILSVRSLFNPKLGLSFSGLPSRFATVNESFTVKPIQQKCRIAFFFAPRKRGASCIVDDEDKTLALIQGGSFLAVPSLFNTVSVPELFF